MCRQIGKEIKLSNEKRRRRLTRATVSRKMDRSRQVGKRKGLTINMERTESTRLRLVGKRIRLSKDEVDTTCSFGFPKPRFRLQTEKVGVWTLVEKLFNLLSRNNGGSCPNQKNSGKKTQFQFSFRSQIPSLQSARSL